MGMDIGVAGTHGIGSFDFTSKPYLLPEKKASGTIRKTGAALILDSGPLENERLNLRLSIGYERADLDARETDKTESFDCFNTDIALGIGMVSFSRFKLWLGPDLRLGLARGSGPDFTDDVLARVVGFGAQAGADYSPCEDLRLAVSVGVRHEVYRSGGQVGADNSLSGSASYGYVSLAVLYMVK